MRVPCQCMAIEDDFGQMVCKKCRGDWYGCECSTEHSFNCTDSLSRRTPRDIELETDNRVLASYARRLEEAGYRVYKILDDITKGT